MRNSKCTTWKLAQHQIFLDYEITNKNCSYDRSCPLCLATKSLMMFDDEKWKESWDFQFPKKKKDLSRLNLDNCKSIWVYVEEKNSAQKNFLSHVLYITIL